MLINVYGIAKTLFVEGRFENTDNVHQNRKKVLDE